MRTHLQPGSHVLLVIPEPGDAAAPEARNPLLAGEFIIDGQPKTVSQLAPGTVLTATIVTRVAPVTVRTISITNGTIVHVQGRSVSARLENGEVRSFRVPANFMFTVDGKQVPVSELKKGMKATATRVVTEPVTELSTLMEVAGKAPK